jgi:multidrug efflux system membrane fusion protein
MGWFNSFRPEAGYRVRTLNADPVVAAWAAAEEQSHRDGTCCRYGHCIAVLALACAGLVSLASCSPKNAESQAVTRNIAVPVTIATVVQKTVPVELRAIGNVEAYSAVSVKPQLDGAVEQAYFKEGQDVKKGDPLFTLDSRPHQAELQQLEANLARDQAQLENARAQAERYTRLFQEGIVSKEQYDSFRTNADALAAAVLADKAAIARAKIDLDYCSIRSPMAGRTGSLLVYPGNIVKANETILVVINQITPIYVSFSVPEQNLAEIKQRMAAVSLPVAAIVPDDELHPVPGTLTFVANAVDNTTGTIRLKATFANAERRLWPGQFVNVLLRLTSRPNAIVVPSQAVQTGQLGQYVFVVKPDMSAESRPVVSGSTVGGETVIEEGLQLGENVVTDGQLRLAPGSKVELKSAVTSEK